MTSVFSTDLILLLYRKLPVSFFSVTATVPAPAAFAAASALLSEAELNAASSGRKYTSVTFRTGSTGTSELSSEEIGSSLSEEASSLDGGVHADSEESELLLRLLKNSTSGFPSPNPSTPSAHAATTVMTIVMTCFRLLFRLL